ncbi:MAG: formylglycine-generating enzyme required for sulfatase activity/serine/threonine protein kinase [Planctomycetota bacterium]|jgi:formylglycine-generating enzyme required for sulfatase activity/serine/threonine protein kinase
MTSEAERYARVHEVLNGALKLFGDDLDAYLEDACGEDKALRAEVAELLSAGRDDDPGDPFADVRIEGARRALEALLDADGEDAETPAHGLEAGPDWDAFSSDFLERLMARRDGGPRYELKGKIGAGGQGVVLQVWDEDLKRNLAMKVILRHGDADSIDGTPPVSSRTLSRFLEEAQITGQLDHPGIVPVHELGLDAEGRVFFTMKLVEGDTLSSIFDHVKRGENGRTQARALGLLLRVCDAMAYAHDKGVIHRDLKPANIMVGRFGEVFVMDWGVARVLGEEDFRDLRLEPSSTVRMRSERRETSPDGDSALLTMDGDVVGTPQYMPPEQASGQIDEMEPRSDVYSIGAMLYELIAGHPPFMRPGQRSTPLGIVQRVQKGPPDPLLQRAPSAPAELVAICERAMAHAPGDRYTDIPALRDDLSAFLEQRVVLAYQTGAVAELRKWVQRNTKLAAALGAAVLALTVGLVIALTLKTQAERSRNEVLQLSAQQDVVDLLLRADELWPAYPEQIEAYAEWIDTARTLTARLPYYRAQREKLHMRVRAAAQTGRAAGMGAQQSQARWWDNQLSKLIGQLETIDTELLAATDDASSATHGWSVPRRKAFAERLRDGYRPGGDFAQAWDAALPPLRAVYPDLDLAPQTGLIPLGPDPDSGLWEFGDRATATPPSRDDSGQLLLTEKSALVFVLMHGGTFTMGAQSGDESDLNFDPGAQLNEGPTRDVTLSPFFISKFEMTQGQWSRFTGSNPSVYAPPNPLATSLLHPVETVNWHACRETCARLGLRLPTEAQWEYAARGGRSSPFWTGDSPESLKAKRAANVADETARANTSWTVTFEPWKDGHVIHAPVGTYAPNPFGLHEVHGNVWEWTRDAFSSGDYTEKYEPDPTNTPSESSRIVYRGGSFNAPAASARLAYRDYDTPELAHNSTGLRPARAVEK